MGMGKIDKKRKIFLFYATGYIQIKNFLDEIREFTYNSRYSITIFYFQKEAVIKKKLFNESSIKFRLINLNKGNKNLFEIFNFVNHIIKNELSIGNYPFVTLAMSEIVYSYDIFCSIFISACNLNNINLVCKAHDPYTFGDSFFSHFKGWSQSQPKIIYLKNLIHSFLALIINIYFTKKIYKLANLKLLFFGVLNAQFYRYYLVYYESTLIKEITDKKYIYITKPTINKFLEIKNQITRKPTIYLVTSGTFAINQNTELKNDSYEIFRKVIQGYKKFFFNDFSLSIIGKQREIKNLKNIFKDISLFTRNEVTQEEKDRFILPLCSGALVELAEKSPKSLCIPYCIENQVHYKIKEPNLNNKLYVGKNLNNNSEWETAYDLVHKLTNLHTYWGLKNKNNTTKVIENILSRK